MKWAKKIKAFTLSELLVVLLLTVVVVGLAFAILNLVQKQMSTTRKNYDNGTELQQLRQVLWRDFRSYQHSFFSKQEEKLIFENEMERVQYTFLQNYLIREQDTFKIQLARKVFYFEGGAVQEGRINALELFTTKEMNKKTVFVYRENDATIYMNE